MRVQPWRSGMPDRPEVPPWTRWRAGRPLKRWRYVGYYGPEVMLCVARAQIGVARVAWWAIWDRGQRTLAEANHRTGRGVELGAGCAEVDDGIVRISLRFAESPGVETISPHGEQPIWTRKHGGVHITGTASVGDRTLELDGYGMIDDSAGWHARATAWAWSAGVGVGAGGERVAWNFVEGVHDDAAASERTVWVDDEAHHVAPQVFAHDLSRVGGLDFSAEATLRKRERLIVMSNEYEQPFGTFSGTLPVGDGLALAEGYGVMERHDVRW